MTCKWPHPGFLPLLLQIIFGTPFLFPHPAHFPRLLIHIDTTLFHGEELYGFGLILPGTAPAAAPLAHEH